MRFESGGQWGGGPCDTEMGDAKIIDTGVKSNTVNPNACEMKRRGNPGVDASNSDSTSADPNQFDTAPSSCDEDERDATSLHDVPKIRAKVGHELRALLDGDVVNYKGLACFHAIAFIGAFALMFVVVRLAVWSDEVIGPHVSKIMRAYY